MSYARITVMGSFIVDLMARADHLPVPGETVLGTDFKIGPGGKGSNQAVERYIEPFRVDMVDTTGAGDAFNGALATALAEGKDLIFAARFANAAGALSVTKIGTAASMPYRQEIEALLNMR